MTASGRIQPIPSSEIEWLLLADSGLQYLVNRQQAYEIASSALDTQRSVAIEDLIGRVGTKEESTVAGADGQTYFVEIRFEQLSSGPGVRVTAVVDLGSSYRLERIEESIEICAD